MRSLLPSLTALLLALGPLQAASREAEWKAVDEAMQQGLPKTAIERLEPIIAAALKEKAYGEATKAIARRVVLEATIQGNKPEERITRLAVEVERAPAEIKPLLQTLLAHAYWSYFQGNRWRFMQRTATRQAPGPDFTTWDLPRLFAEIDKRFQDSLANVDLLRRTPVALFNDLLTRGTVPDAYRPTLYDFLAWEALGFYTSGEQAAAKPQDSYQIPASSPALGTVDAFLAWDPAPAGSTLDLDSPLIRALRLYQQLLRFHQNDTDPAAFADADLARLVWVHQVAVGEEKDARYEDALKAFVARWADHEISTLARHHWALQLQARGDLVQARAVALEATQVFHQSPGSRLCANLVTSIEAPALELQAEHVWNAPLPDLLVHYRNLTNVHFRALRQNWEETNLRVGGLAAFADEDQRSKLLERKPDFVWSAPLPRTDDFRQRVHPLTPPGDLAPGYYLVIASAKADFAPTGNFLAFTDVWVSDLALVQRNHAERLEGFVLLAGPGTPVNGAQVEAWLHKQDGTLISAPGGTTDTNGFFSIAAEPHRLHRLRVRHGPHELASHDPVSTAARPASHPSEQSVLFTDRALYRPGQTIQYKGISLHVDQETDAYHVITNRNVTVVFLDSNQKEIERQVRRLNDYGSFSGSFTAPRDRLTGHMFLRVTEGPPGTAAVRVEEYKRPKFAVTVDAPKSPARLNEKVAVPGKAEHYTGAPVDGAEVRYRVVRQVRYPIWWGWRFGGRSRGQESQEIAHGTARTRPDGSFTIEFLARPDPAADEQDEASFSFAVHADVTDAAGETRSGELTVVVGFRALQASLQANPWQEIDRDIELKLEITSLDGEGQSAEGVVKVRRLVEPDRVHRPPLFHPEPWRPVPLRSSPGAKDLSDPTHWTEGDVVFERGFNTDAKGRQTLQARLPAGVYRASLETQDRYGKRVTAVLPLQVLDPAAPRLAAKLPDLLAAPDWELQPGDEFRALWGTGYDAGRAFVEIEHRGRFLQRFWTDPAATQHQIRQAVTEALRGGFTLHVTHVQENRAYLHARRIDVPWSNKDLHLRWEHFTSKLDPGKRETWTAIISAGKDPTAATRAAAEMVATLYDASLDAFAPLHWQERFGIFRQDFSQRLASFQNRLEGFQWLQADLSPSYDHVPRNYREFPPDLVAHLRGFPAGRGGIMLQRTVAVGSLVPAETPMIAEAMAAPARVDAPAFEKTAPSAVPDSAAAGVATGGGVPAAPAIDLSGVTARKVLDETAFFFPTLLADSNGVVRMEFNMPEALTRWRFLGFAHDRSLRSGFLQDQAVTAKELMIQPNPPRFLREGDELEFTVRVQNQSDQPQTGKVRLSFQNAWDASSADALLGNRRPEVAFEVPARQSRSYAWKIRVPDAAPFLTYKAVGATDKLSDGEEGYLPVLSRRVLITESLPLPIRGPATRKFEFTKLLKSGGSDSLQHQSLTVQMVSHPAWYAVLALPYLMEFPYECSEQTFNRLYANAIARSIATRDPKIRRVFDQWKGTTALDSPLEKNADLKSVALEETPWLRQAQAESQARRNVGVLFDDNRLASETAATLRKLTEAQLPDGAWPWFPGGPRNDYITLYIVSGFGRLRHLGVDVPVNPAIRALNRLDAWMSERHREILKQPKPDDYVPSATDALYLYGRSFFLKDRPIPPTHRPAIEFFLAQSRKHGLRLDNRQSQGHLALALRRFATAAGQPDPTPDAIVKSLRERSVTSEELGMFWRDTELSWWWYRAPIETQALMIEVFDEVAQDVRSVEELRVWLLKQKQTADWKTTKATADAVYALLLRGQDLLASDALVEIRLDGVDLTPRTATRADGKQATAKAAPAGPPEAGTGYYEKRFAAGEIRPKLGNVQVRKTDPGVAWGSVHWQYLEDLGKVTPHTGTPLKLTKSLYVKRNSPQGPTLDPVVGPVAVGDELVVRIELRTDRDMEYVHLKDQRGSGTEPIDVLSSYRVQDGLAYYQSTRDTATHFFIDYLPKGTYVFEYSTRVQHRGDYPAGVAEIQCLYAPEFNSHSASPKLQVR